jgi:hypothetical protein
MIDTDPETEQFDLADLLWLVAEMPRTPSTPDEILDDAAARDIDLAGDRLATLLAEGQAQDLLVLWEHDRSLYATLSPLAMEQLDLQMGVCSDRFYPRRRDFTPQMAADAHRRAFHQDPQSVFGAYAPGDEHRSRYAGIDPAVYIDPTCPEPLDVLVWQEECRGDLLRDGSRVTLHQILGIGLPWPQAFEERLLRIKGQGFALLKKVCQGCEARKLPRDAYCAICHRSGVDGKFPPIEPELRQQGRKKFAETDVGGGTGPAKTQKVAS